jgi:hypothetical protein
MALKDQLRNVRQGRPALFRPPVTSSARLKEEPVTKSLNAVEAIMAARRVLEDHPEAVYELRALGVRTSDGRPSMTVSGYFNDVALMAQHAAKLSGRAEGIYVTLNPAKEALLARAANRVAYSPKRTTKDEEIACYRLLLVDVDPNRESGISSTDEEHAAALERAQQIRQWLMEERNWPAPASADSGNGAHLLWPIELPNNDQSKQLLHSTLKALAQRFNDNKVKVDTSTFNAAQISKAYGTLACKGDNTAERPHRIAQLLDVPTEWTAVSREQLEQLASEAAPVDSRAERPASASAELQAVLQALAEQRSITAAKPEPYKDGLKYILSACMFSEQHTGTGTSVAIIEYGSGAKQYSCLHTECKGKRKWGDVLRELELEKKNASTAAGPPSRVNISQLPDVRTFAAQEIEFLVPGVVVKNTITLITGPPGSGKTTLALWMGNAVARGGEILGGTCEQHPVLYMTREMPAALAADMARRFQIDNGPDTNFVMWGPWSDELPPEPAATCIQEWVSQCEIPPLIIIDPCIAFFPPGASENDSVAVRQFLEQGRALLRAGAAGVIYLHHTGKAASAQDFRGSSDFMAAVDLGYKVSNSGDNLLDKLVMKLWRPRFGKERDTLVLQYSERDGVASFKSDEGPTAVRDSITQRLTKILAVCPFPGATIKEFERAAMAKGVTQAIARSFLEKGVIHGTIIREKGKHNRMFHRLPEATELIQ